MHGIDPLRSTTGSKFSNVGLTLHLIGSSKIRTSLVLGSVAATSSEKLGIRAYWYLSITLAVFPVGPACNRAFTRSKSSIPSDEKDNMRDIDSSDYKHTEF